MEFESKLIPILREGVSVIKLILFKKLTAKIEGQFPDRERAFVNRLAGAVINDIFCTPNTEPAFADFVRRHQAEIDVVVLSIAGDFQEMLIPLTDALRVAVLCDHQEGTDSSAVLMKADRLHILLVERDLPLPHHFLELVRRLGAAFGLLLPPAARSST